MSVENTVFQSVVLVAFDVSNLRDCLFVFGDRTKIRSRFVM